MITDQRRVACECDICGTTSPFVVAADPYASPIPNAAERGAVDAGWRKCRVVPLAPILTAAGFPPKLAERAVSRPSGMSEFDWIVCPQCAQEYDAWLQAPRFPD